jgi:hypothetical protein
MNTPKRIGIGLAAFAALLLIVGFFLPAKWTVERSVFIGAPPEAIYPLAADFKNGWSQWSAFDNEDPDIRYHYIGPAVGPGAERAWASKKMGDGRQKIVAASPETGVEFELVMDNGFLIRGLIAFEKRATGTQVTWTDWGEVGRNPIHRYMGLMMDRMMGDTFETSLQKLKQLAEGKK